MIAMAAHFLLSPLCRTLSVAEVARMSEEEAWRAFCRIRWAATGGDPVCPRCRVGPLRPAGTAQVDLQKLRLRVQRHCRNDPGRPQDELRRSAAGHLPVRQRGQGPAGSSAVPRGRVRLQGRLRAAAQASGVPGGRAGTASSGGAGTECETDTAYFGGYGKPANHQENRRDLRLAENRTGKRQCVVVVRQRDGGTATAVIPGEAAAPAFVRRKVERGGVIHADEGAAFDELHARYVMARINHEEAYSKDGACTNQAESFFSRMRRAEVGIHHHIAGLYLRRYAAEMSWREDMRATDNSRLTSEVAALTLGRGHSVDWRGTGGAGSTRPDHQPATLQRAFQPSSAPTRSTMPRCHCRRMTLWTLCWKATASF